jgi:hypothetical protein
MRSPDTTRVDAVRQKALSVAGLALLILEGKGDAVELLDEAAEAAEQLVRDIETARRWMRGSD